MNLYSINKRINELISNIDKISEEEKQELCDLLEKVLEDESIKKLQK